MNSLINAFLLSCGVGIAIASYPDVPMVLLSGILLSLFAARVTPDE